MSLYDYQISKQISSTDPPFCALIMAAMRKADPQNAARLLMVFPTVHDELEARYNAPGGVLPEELDVVDQRWAQHWANQPEGHEKESQ